MRETGREKTRKTAVLIPCYNESQTIEKVIRSSGRLFRRQISTSTTIILQTAQESWRERQEPLCGRNTFRERET